MVPKTMRSEWKNRSCSRCNLASSRGSVCHVVVIMEEGGGHGSFFGSSRDEYGTSNILKPVTSSMDPPSKTIEKAI